MGSKGFEDSKAFQGHAKGFMGCHDQMAAHDSIGCDPIVVGDPMGSGDPIGCGSTARRSGTCFACQRREHAR